MGLWGDDLGFRIPDKLPPLPRRPSTPPVCRSRRGRPPHRSADRAHRAHRACEVARPDRSDPLRHAARRRRHRPPHPRSRKRRPFRERGFDVQFQIPIFDGGEVVSGSATETYNRGFQPADRKGGQCPVRSARRLPRLPVDLRHREPLPARSPAAARDHHRRDAAAILQHAGRRVRAAHRSASARRVVTRGHRSQARFLAGAVGSQGHRQRRRVGRKRGSDTTARPHRAADTSH